MKSRLHWRTPVVVCAAVFMLTAVTLQRPVDAQGPAKRPISYDVMDYWRSIGGTRLSNDGKWLAYSLTSQGDDPELIVRNLASGQEFKHARGTGPQFTPDNALLLFTIAPPRSENEQNQNQAAGEAGAAPQAGAPAGGRGAGAGGGNGARNSLGIMTLADGKVTTVERAGTFRLAEESSTWVAYTRGGGAAGAGGRGGNRGGAAPGGAAAGGRGGGGGGRGGGGATEPPPAQAQTPPAAPGRGNAPGAAQTPAAPAKQPGNDLILRNLQSGQETTVPEVTEYAWDKTASRLLYAVSSTDAAKDGVFIRHMADGAVTPIKSGRGRYRSASFDEAEKQVVFVSDTVDFDKPVAPYRVYYWKMGDGAATELVSATTKGMPANFVVSDNFAPTFSQDGERINLATEPAPPPPADPNVRRPAPLPVDIWTNRDAQIQPMQRVRATQDRNRNYRAIVHLSNKQLVQLATPDLPNVTPGFDAVRAIGTSDLAYQQEVSWDQGYNDVYLVELKTGARRKILEHWGAQATLSPGGKYVLYFDEKEGDWFTYRIADGTRTNLTDSRPVKFFDEGHDTPDLPGPLGVAGWTANDATVLLNDQFDIWEMRPDGTNARMVTNGEGRKQHLVFRYRTFDTQQRAIPTDKPILLTTTNDDTKATGYYRVNYASGSTPAKVIMMDKAMGAPTKARNADTVVFTESRFDEFPDLWVSDINFTTPKKVTNANPQQSEYVWGKAENIKYLNADGKTLNAMLIKPENFDPTKKYPMMVYIYEELSQGLHGYRAPNVGTSVNLTRYVSNGYIVLQPDIVYETGYPGPSAMKCVIPAINTVLAQGYVDPKRVGIQGHSWGGYQITYMITQTNMFAAVQAGASVSNMISAYGGIRWGTGMVRQFQYEKTQSRIGSTPWDSPLQFIENSPIFWVERINTPYLSIHNDGDDAVPWYQGIEFNMAMRRLGKEAYMFNYNGQPHGLNNRDYMKHWTVHMDEFFDHYLLGKPRPEWMDKGVSFLDRGTRDVSGMFKRAVNPPSAGGGR
jgi:dipeptidyl aminopeptidase/acylaminoacyl peptidase